MWCPLSIRCRCRTDEEIMVRGPKEWSSGLFFVVVVLSGGMGTVFQVPWTYIGESAADWPEAGLERLAALGFRTVALALSDDSVDIDDPALLAEPRLAMVLGTEGDGLAPSTVAHCDYTARIPMAHGVDSLNVAAAGAVAFWTLCRRKSNM